MGQPDVAISIIGVPINLVELGKVLGVEPDPAYPDEELGIDDLTKKLREMDPAFGVGQHGRGAGANPHYVGIMATTDLDGQRFVSVSGAKQRIAKLRAVLEPKGLWDDDRFGLHACCEEWE